jgi:hypothetical protein
MGISAALDAIVARVEAAVSVGEPVLNVSVLPGTLDLDTELSKRSHRIPGIFVSFMSGDQFEDDQFARLTAQIGLLFVWRSPKEPTRRASVTPVMEVVLPLLHNWRVPDCGTMTLKSVNAMYSEKLDEVGLTLFVATFALPIPLPAPADPQAAIANLVTIHGDWMVDDPNSLAGTTLPMADGTQTTTTTALPPQT